MELEGINKRCVQFAKVFFAMAMVAILVYSGIVLVNRHIDDMHKEEEVLSEINADLEEVSTMLEVSPGFRDYPIFSETFDTVSQEIEKVKKAFENAENLYGTGQPGFVIDDNSRPWYYTTVSAVDEIKKLLDEVEMDNLNQRTELVNSSLETDYQIIESKLARIQSRLSNLRIVGHDAESKRCEELQETYNTCYNTFYENLKIVKAEVENLYNEYKVLKSGYQEMDSNMAQALYNIELWDESKEIDIELLRQIGEELKEESSQDEGEG